MTALSDAVAEATASLSRLYSINAVPASPTYPYGSWSAVLGRGDTYTLDSARGLRWGRITAQFFGKTEASATTLAEQFIAALLDKTLGITGFQTTPCRLELDPAVTRDPDNQGVVGVTVALTFTAATTA